MNPRWRIILKAVALSFAGVLALLFVMSSSSAGQAGTFRAGAPWAAASSGEAPGVSAVSPPSIPNDLDAEIAITGTGFTRELSGTVMMLPAIALDGAALAEVGWVSSTFMTATVPWGLDPGVYTLAVTNPDGQTSSLAGALTVTQGIGVWTSDGPYGGVVNDILLHPLDKNTLYATLQSYASASGIGLFRSRDRGASWQLVLAGIGNQYHAAGLSAPAPVTLYVHKWGQGLVRSDDGGDHWTALPLPEGGCAELRPFASPLDPQTVYAAADCAFSGGLYKSLDRGESWISVTTGLTDTHVTALAFDPVGPQVLYAGTRSGNVFRSGDGGASWTPAGKPDQFIAGLAVNPFGDREPWAAGADSSGHWGYLWKYVAGNWVQVLPGSGGENQVNAIQFSPAITGTLWIGTFQGGLKSTDGGDTWEPLGGPSPHVNTLAVDPTDPQTIYLGYSGEGIARTGDGGASWVVLNQGLAGVLPNGLAIHPGDPAVVYATAHGAGAFKTRDGGGSWLKLPSDNLIPVAPVVDPADPRRVYVGAGSGLEISADAGAAWRRVLLDPPPAYAGCCSVQVLALLALQQPGQLVLGAGFQEKGAASYGFTAGGIYTSGDYGESWAYVELGQAIAPVTVLAADPQDPATVYAGAGKLGLLQGAGVWKSEDGGATWSPSGLAGQQVTGIAVDPSDPRLVYATNMEKFYASPDGGATWELRGDPATGLENLLAVPTTPAALYRYGWQGMARSPDGGRRWERAAGTLGYANISAMAATGVEGRVVLYTGSGGGSVTDTAMGGPGLAPTAETLVKAGVYRNTVRLENPRVYLPLVRK